VTKCSTGTLQSIVTGKSSSHSRIMLRVPRTCHPVSISPGFNRVLNMTEESMNNFKCLSVEKVEGVTIVSLLDDKLADPVRVEQLGKELLALADLQPPLVVVSFKGVRFFSSAAINKLVVVERRIKARQGALILTELEPTLRDLFSFSLLDNHFVIREDRTAALAELLPTKK
jgi:anti-sigma B factor antagonist